MKISFSLNFAVKMEDDEKHAFFSFHLYLFYRF